MASADQTLSQALHALFISKHGADVTFIVHGTEIEAHKTIVTARSTVLKAMIEGPMASADQRHEIADPAITADDFENFLKFLYTDKCDIERSNVKVMLHLANFYNVTHLHSECARQLYRFLDSEDNVLEYAELGLQHSPESLLLQRCFNIFDTHHSKTTLTYRSDDGTIVWISPELALEFVKYKKSSNRIREDKLFEKVFEWSKNSCIQQNQEVNVENVQANMAPIMPHFEPQQFSPFLLATAIKDYKLLPDSQLIECLSDSVIAARSRRNCGSENCRCSRGYDTRPPPYHGRGTAAAAGGFLFLRGNVRGGAPRGGVGVNVGRGGGYGGYGNPPSPPPPARAPDMD